MKHVYLVASKTISSYSGGMSHRDEEQESGLFP